MTLNKRKDIFAFFSSLISVWSWKL